MLALVTSQGVNIRWAQSDAPFLC